MKVRQFVPGKEYVIKAVDEFKFNTTPSAMKEKFNKELEKMSDDSTVTAGFESTLKLKLGCRVIDTKNYSEWNNSNGDTRHVISIKRQVPFI